jgi:SAM-dependent methyltransferase
MDVNYTIDLLQRDDQERNHIIRELVLIKEEYKIKDCTVVDLGCGTGNNLESFKNDNNVLGFEGLASAVSVARSRALPVCEADLEQRLEMPDSSADWVLCLDVLEHLVNPIKLMHEINRVLRVNGKAVINVPNHFDLTGRMRILHGHSLDVHRFFPDSHDWDNPHLRFFTHRGIKQMVAAAGFKLVDDRSWKFHAFPKKRFFESIGLTFLLRHLAVKYPPAFAAGFFLIIEKTAPISETI